MQRQFAGLTPKRRPRGLPVPSVACRAVPFRDAAFKDKDEENPAIASVFVPGTKRLLWSPPPPVLRAESPQETNIQTDATFGEKVIITVPKSAKSNTDHRSLVELDDALAPGRRSEQRTLVESCRDQLDPHRKTVTTQTGWQRDCGQT